MKYKLLITVACSLAAVTGAHAAILVDYSPDATGLPMDFYLSNTYVSGFQPFFGFTLTRSTQLTGVDIYSVCGSQACGGYPPIQYRSLAVGDPGLLSLRHDPGAGYGLAPIATYNVNITAIDSLGSSANPGITRVHADFNHVLGPGSYFFGFTGNGIQYGINMTEVSTGQRLFAGAYCCNIGDRFTAAYRVYGSVPEPGSWALMIAGFAMVGGATRRRRVMCAA